MYLIDTLGFVTLDPVGYMKNNLSEEIVINSSPQITPPESATIPICINLDLE